MIAQNSYSKIFQRLHPWNSFKKGTIIELFDSCVEVGITTFDCGNFSGEGKPASNIGRALSESSLSRDEIQIIGNSGKKAISKDSLIASVEDVLLNLETDYLDLLLLNPGNNISELMEAIAQLSAQGKILEVGGWEQNLDQLEKMEKFVPVKANQIKLPVSSTNFGSGILGTSAKKMDILVWYISEGLQPEKKTALKEFLRKYDYNLKQLLFLYLFRHRIYLHIGIDACSEAEIEQFSHLKEEYMNPADWEKINELLQ